MCKRGGGSAAGCGGRTRCTDSSGQGLRAQPPGAHTPVPRPLACQAGPRGLERRGMRWRPSRLAAPSESMVDVPEDGAGSGRAALAGAVALAARRGRRLHSRAPPPRPSESRRRLPAIADSESAGRAPGSPLQPGRPACPGPSNKPPGAWPGRESWRNLTRGTSCRAAHSAHLQSARERWANAGADPPTWESAIPHPMIGCGSGKCTVGDTQGVDD